MLRVWLLSWVRKGYRPVVSFLLAIVLILNGVSWVPGLSIPPASAKTISVNVAPSAFVPVYGGKANINWGYQDSPHQTSIEACTVEYVPPPPPPAPVEGAPPYDPPTPYNRTSLEKIAEVPASGNKQYTYEWDGLEYGS